MTKWGNETLFIIAAMIALAILASCERYAAHTAPSPTPSLEASTPTEVPATPTLVPATPTLVPLPPSPTVTATPQPQVFVATRYGVSYNNLPMGCIGAGNYSSDDPTILAAPPARYAEWPCGTVLNVCYRDRCQEMVRKDSCPGCAANHIDLSEAGLWYLAQCQCDILNNVTVVVLDRPATITEPSMIENLLVDRCGGLIDIRERRAPCVVEVLRSILLQ